MISLINISKKFKDKSIIDSHKNPFVKFLSVYYLDFLYYLL